MAITTLSSREFNHDTGRAKRAAAKGPVFITDRGKPAHVLLTIKEYRRLSAKKFRTLGEAISMDVEDNYKFDPPKLDDSFLHPAELD
jgi:PHD/YefM family antitoxin component YafN of YafNO toxin-antitoxin module